MVTRETVEEIVRDGSKELRLALATEVEAKGVSGILANGSIAAKFLRNEDKEVRGVYANSLRAEIEYEKRPSRMQKTTNGSPFPFGDYGGI